MAKRRALEDLDAMQGVTSPAPKKQKSQGHEVHLNGQIAHDEAGWGTADTSEAKQVVSNELDGSDPEDDSEDETAMPAIRQAAPTAGYDDLYLDTINRQVLDFDFEKLCSVSLSNINVYACLVCGRYYQGRGLKSHAYFHALDEDHHVFINMQTQRVYVLPEGYEVLSRSLDDIKFVADPRYTRSDVARLDQRRSAASRPCYTLTGKPYAPGYVGMNNIKENDYLNVVVQALAHVPPLRNFLLLDEFTTRTTGSSKPDAKSLDNPNAELVKRFGLLVRKIWNPRAFKAHVSPHELLQEVALRSNKRFTLTAQADPVDFLTWFLNHLHLGLGGSRTRPGSSIVQRVFQGKLRVETEKLAAVGIAAAAAAAAAAAVAAEQGTIGNATDAADSMMIDVSLPVRLEGGMLTSLPTPPGMIQQLSSQYHPPPPGIGGPPTFSSFAQPPPPGVSSAPGMFAAPPPPPGPPGLSGTGVTSLPPPPSSLPPPPPSFISTTIRPLEPQQQNQLQNGEASAVPPPSTYPPQPTIDINRFLLLTLDLPPPPLFQDEQERNIIPQVPLTTLLSKYDGQSAHIAHVDHGDVRRRFQLQGPLPPYLVLHMKRFTANKFTTERNPTIVTFDPRGLDMRPYVEGAERDREDEYTYDLVANVVHEAVRARGDDAAMDSAEERRTWKVQLRDRSATTAANGEQAAVLAGASAGEDKWVVAQDLFVEPVAGELLYLAESYIQIWERRRQPSPSKPNAKPMRRPTAS
ncbi:Ubiquitin carboxyl-terminal hydrolase 10 [Sporothrix epigloea]|uniref:Ubiquitin carboxyl-terminal hydrolase 10 n=1 Tax=Sporothrix epigloea TaxID=1892477 RepID=A0ABP0DJM6_9PEZI